MGKRELVALLSLSSWCLVMVVWLILPIPWVYCLQFVIVVFPDHTHLIYFIQEHRYNNNLPLMSQVGLVLVHCLFAWHVLMIAAEMV